LNDDVDLKKTKTVQPLEETHDKIDIELMKVRDKVKIIDDVKNNPPKPDEMQQVIPEGAYVVDLDTLLAAQITDCPATVIPMLIDHGVRTAVDIKQTYKPEKRMLGFQYWWIIILIVGLMMLFLFGSMFGLF